MKHGSNPYIHKLILSLLEFSRCIDFGEYPDPDLTLIEQVYPEKAEKVFYSKYYQFIPEFIQYFKINGRD